MTVGTGLPGVAMQASYTRIYPDGDVTANLVGFTHTTATGNLTGAAGLEQSDNALLAGRPAASKSRSAPTASRSRWPRARTRPRSTAAGCA